ncbi:MAG TPA: hypothetical protein VIE42_13025 [Steroidobacteraceae bacterium]
MRPSRTMFVVVAASLAACGGDSSSVSNGGEGMHYTFVTPPANSQRVYSETIEDNLHSTIFLSYTETVTAVNANGSYTVLREDPNHEAPVVDGTTYGIQTETLFENNSGQTTFYDPGAPGGVPLPCTYTPHGPGPDFPVAVGEAWTLDYTFGCEPQGPIAYVQNGTLTDVESVTVPAGTFNALKLQSTISWTDTLGTTRTQTVTNWRDVLTLVSVKESVTIDYAGPLPVTGYPLSRETVLQSLR